MLVLVEPDRVKRKEKYTGRDKTTRTKRERERERGGPEIVGRAAKT